MKMRHGRVIAENRPKISAAVPIDTTGISEINAGVVNMAVLKKRDGRHVAVRYLFCKIY